MPTARHLLVATVFASPRAAARPPTLIGTYNPNGEYRFTVDAKTAPRYGW